MVQNKYGHYVKVFLKDPAGTSRTIRESLANSANYLTLRETFVKQQYWWLASNLLKGTVVVDIGANIGDSAIYFSQFDRVRSVIAYEPMPLMYRYAKSNIQSLPAPLLSKIKLRNVAVGRDEVRRIPREEGSHVSRYDSARSSGEGEEVRSITLERALRGLRNVAVKCDCEGMEYGIFTPEADLSNVYAIQMEYHFGAERLARVLAAKGFRVTHEDNIRKGVGQIYALRNPGRSRR